MLAVSKVIGPISLTKMHKRKALTRICFGSKDPDFKSLNPSLVNASGTPRSLTYLNKTIGMISVIKEIVVIVALANLDFKALL